MNSLPDWKIPPGTSRGLLAYTADADLAAGYDQALADNPLLRHDLEFCARHFIQPGSLLDLGCGTGRLLIPFAGRGFRVLGVDLSAAMLAVANRKAAALGVSVALVQANLVELDAIREQAFDYAACLFSTLGMVIGFEHRRRVLDHIFRLLRPGGRLVVHGHNLWHHLGTRAGRRWLLGDRWRFLRGSDAAGDFEMPPRGTIAGLALHQFTRGEMRGLLRSAGFSILELEPVSLREDCRLPMPWLLPGLRAYGFLIAAERPAP